MNITCNDRERIFADGAPEEWLALETHAASCIECAEELRAWKSLSVAAQEFKEDWDSPSLWPRIARSLGEQGRSQRTWLQKWVDALRVAELRWQTAAATIALLLFTGAAAWFVTFHGEKGPRFDNQALLNNRAVDEVEKAEAAYVRAIAKLNAQAGPQLQDPATSLMANYREKLLVLDSAIAELRSQAEQNPGNAHLRRQLLAMYQEKQTTLEDVLEEKQ
jgi:hypothetical protein